MPTERQRGSFPRGRRRAKSMRAAFSDSMLAIVIDALRSIGELLASGHAPAVGVPASREQRDFERSAETRALLAAWDRYRVGRSKPDTELIAGFADEWKAAHPKSRLIPSIRRISDYRRKFPVNGNIDGRGRRS